MLSHLVRIEWVVKSEGVSKGTKVAGAVFVIQRAPPCDAGLRRCDALAGDDTCLC